MVNLLCVGDLNADLAISLTNDLVIGSDTDGTIDMHGGGSAANVAVWAARAGATVAFVGVVGNDDLGTFLVDGMVQAGVNAHVIQRAGASTRAVAAIVGPDGNRSLVSDLSGQTALVDGDVDTNLLAAASWLHLTGYTFLTDQSRPLFVQLTKQASEHGIPWSIDPSAAQLIRARSDVASARAAFSGCAVMFPSDDEAALLADVDDPVMAADSLLDLADCVVVTRGADGATVARRGRPTFSVPAAPTELCNTLGCGDAFAAGFLTARISGADDQICAAAGTATAARAASLSAAR